MDSNNIPMKKKRKFKKIKSKANLSKINSKYILMIIFDNLQSKNKLNIIKYNKNLQNKLNINLNDYAEYSQIYSPIIIELIPKENTFGKFININKSKDDSFFHIYYNNKKKEIKKRKRNFLKENTTIKKIKIKIDYQIISFHQLFSDCKCIESINIIKFNRTNINNMCCMFSGCSSLKEINFENFNTNNVINMSYMFFNCSSLLEVNFPFINTNNLFNFFIFKNF